VESETVGAKHRITQWVPGSWAGNSRCPTSIQAETVSRHNEVMTPGRTKMLSSGHIRDWSAVVHQVPGSLVIWRQLCTIDTSLNFTWTAVVVDQTTLWIFYILL